MNDFERGMNAHERAVAEAKAWVEAYADELAVDVDPPLLPNGEVNLAERSSWMSYTTRGKPSPIGDSFEEFERSATIVYPWSSKSPYQRALTELFDLVLANMKTKDEAVLRSYFFEGYSLEQLGVVSGVTYQAMQQRLATALQNFKLTLLNVAGVEVPGVNLASVPGRPVRNREAENVKAAEVFENWRAAVKDVQQISLDLVALLESGPAYKTPNREEEDE